MLEKHRRQKKPRAHPHFVWADPERFYIERMTAGLTQDQACKYLGVTRRTIYNWENGKTRIPFPASSCSGCTLGPSSMCRAPEPPRLDERRQWD